MTIDPLVTVADLTAMKIDTSDTSLVGMLLDAASASIRDAAGDIIAPATTSVIELSGSGEQYLPIGVWSLRSVSTVEIDGVAVADWRVVDGRLWRAAGWGGWSVPATVKVTLEHGLDDTPADLVPLVASLVGAGVAASKEGMAGHRGLQYESIDDYRVGFTAGNQEVVDVMGLPSGTRAWLASRFGGGAHVTGSY